MPAGPGRNRRHFGLAAVATVTALAAPLLLTASVSQATAPSAAAHEGTGQADGQSGPTAEERARNGDELAEGLVARTGSDGATRHLKALRDIAGESGGNRAAGTPGHRRSAEYAGRLLESAGYEVTYQDFEFTYRKTLAEQLTIRTPGRGAGQQKVPVSFMTYAGSTPEGGTPAALVEVPPDADGRTGCEAADYRTPAPGGFAGRTALIERGGCTFAQKQEAAAAAGAVGAVVYNDTEGELEGTLEKPGAGRIPVGGISKQDGEALSARLARGGTPTAVLELREFQERRTTRNVVAETRDGDPDRVVMLGAHLDSVADGPGINDNGSGAAGLLETALQLAAAGQSRTGEGHPDKVRFALWSAEEVGVRGAEHYVGGLAQPDRDRIALYLNFDMIASPNYGLFVLDGDDSDGVGEGPGPEGSAELEKGIRTFLASQGHPTRGADLNGRSDYGPFADAGIPSGGTSTGAEGIKTEAEQALWGGEAGRAYDSCYHSSCDGADNIDETAFDINIKVMADAVGHYAWDTGGLPQVPAKSPGGCSTNPAQALYHASDGAPS